MSIAASFRIFPIRILPLLFAAALAAVILPSGAARADTLAEGRALVQKMADEVITILANKGIDRAAKERRFRRIFSENFDVPTIGAWVMGSPWRTATKAQQAKFLALFEAYIVKVYTGQLSSYAGEKVSVVGAEEDGTGVAVASRIHDPVNARTVELLWRLRKVGPRLKIRDVVVENISMSQTQRREFSAVYQQRGRSVDGLIQALEEKLTEIDGR